MKQPFNVIAAVTQSFYVRLFGAYLLIVVLLIGTIIYSITEVNQLSDNFANLDKVNTAHEKSKDIQIHFSEESLEFTRMIFLNQTDALINSHGQRADPFDRLFQDYQAINLPGEQNTRFISQLAEESSQHEEVVGKIVAAFEQNKSDQAIALFNGEYSDHLKVTTELLAAHDTWLEQLTLTERAHVTETRSTILTVLTVGGIGITLVALLSATFLVVYMGRSVFRLKKAVDELAAGNLQARVVNPGKDEIGQVSRAFNGMAEHLGDLIESVDNKRRLGLNVSQDVTTIASQLSTAARQQSSQSSQQSSSLNEVAGTMMEIKATANQIANRATQVAGNANGTFHNMNELLELATRTHRAGEVGQQQVKLSLENSHQVQSQVNSYDNVLGELKEHSAQIGDVLQLIKKVADETHLLALNAAIEASGAGQYGNRFKVVADHIKQLADSSLRATAEVSQVAHKVQGSINEVSQAMLQTAEQVKQSVTSSEVVYQSIRELNEALGTMDDRYGYVVGLMEKVNLDVDQIKLMTQQQETALEQIAVTMHQIDSATSETAAAGQQLASMAVQLAGVSGSLTNELAA